MTTAALLEIRNLRKTIGGQPLLDIPALVIEASQCLILSGKNGVGKTTLLKIVAGLEPPDSADVVYRGLTLPWRIARDIYCRDVVYLHQTPYMFDRSVVDNVAYGLRRSGMPRNEIALRVAETLEWAELAHLAKRNARQLSAGEKQRVALARARVFSPRILLLDEPISSMDLESRERTYFLIQRLKSEKIGVVVTSHELQQIAAIGDVHLRLHNSKLHSEGDNPAADKSPSPAYSKITQDNTTVALHRARRNQITDQDDHAES